MAGRDVGKMRVGTQTVRAALQPLVADASTSGIDGALRVPGSTMAEIERFAILKTMEACDGSTTKAAEMLDISVRTIQYRLHEYGAAKKAKTGL